MVITTPIWIAIIVGGVVVIAGLIALASRCRKCGRWFALKATGRIKLTGRSDLGEYRCRHCKFEVWKAHGDTMNSTGTGG